MAESNSNTTLCPCGFFGTPENLGMCSKCYKEHMQRKTAEADNTAPRETNNTSAVSTEQLTQALGNVVTSAAASSPAGPTPTESPKLSEPVGQAPSESTEGATEKAASEISSPPSELADSETSQPSSSNATKRVRENSECDSITDEKPVQKNKKRCFTCNCKLQPAIREIGKCKCELVFCQLHRLPEQHDCIYDHKGTGRQEARDKMVSPKKHMGTSLKRIDSDS